MSLSSDIHARIQAVQEKIEKAAARCGRDAGDVTLVVVTKAQPVEVVQAVIDAGARVLGENYPEETTEKIPHLNIPETLSWHMIGHLQSRKSKLVAEHFHYLQSLDSLSLARKLDRHLEEAGRKMDVLLECNVGEEETKHGWGVSSSSELNSFYADIEAISNLPNLRIRGLMCMPPLFEDAELARPYFLRLRRLRDDLRRDYPMLDWSALSMGTSVDYTVAIEEGATFVRVGTAIVGPRHYA